MRVQVINALVEGVSVCATCRMTGVAYQLLDRAQARAV